MGAFLLPNVFTGVADTALSCAAACAFVLDRDLVDAEAGVVVCADIVGAPKPAAAINVTVTAIFRTLAPLKPL
jgi:hypothetical protein